MHRKMNLTDLYFDWLYSIACGSEYAPSGSYKKLLGDLYDTTFEYTIPMDGNRAVDGVELRYQFGDTFGYSQPEITYHIDSKPCTVLEALIALANRYETHILSDPEFGDRTAQWFWAMLENLGIDEMEDNCYNHEVVMEAVYRFMDHEYARDGTGGLFTTSTDQDMRQIELWYQFSIWYDDMFNEGRY